MLGLSFIFPDTCQDCEFIHGGHMLISIPSSKPCPFQCHKIMGLYPIFKPHNIIMKIISGYIAKFGIMMPERTEKMKFCGLYGLPPSPDENI
jgi:hypothetical protein